MSIESKTGEGIKEKGDLCTITSVHDGGHAHASCIEGLWIKQYNGTVNPDQGDTCVVLGNVEPEEDHPERDDLVAILYKGYAIVIKPERLEKV